MDNTYRYINDHDWVRWVVKQKMFEQGVTRKQLAEELGYCYGTIATYLNGANNNRHVASALIAYFKLPKKNFILRTQEEKENTNG